MATCPSCSQPLGDDDRFCTGCGTSVATPGPPADTCPTCGRKATEPAAFCSGCGAAMASGAAVGRPPAASVPTGFNWKWALLTIPIAVGTALAGCFATGFLIGMSGLDFEDGPMKVVFGAVVILGSMFLSGLIVGWWSPGRTVYEPGVGLAAAIVAVNVLSGEFVSSIWSWLVPFALGAAGAWLGECLQGRSAPR